MENHTAADFESASDFFRRDPRTADWALVGNKQFIVFLIAAYVYIVKIGGPRFMKERKPYDNIKPLILLYNAVMVLLNCYFVGAFLSKSYWGGGYSLFCQGIDFQARDALTMSMLSHLWWYVMVRIADFLDTVFFVLRRKDSHVSFLHVVHHILVVFNGWFGLAYGADGHAAFGTIFNSFVHVVMYSYYFLSLLGPSVQKYLWWKRYLTQFQLAQFVIMFFHMTVPLFVNCGYPLAHICITLPQGVFFFTMFMNFYVKSYSNRRRPQPREEAKNKDQ
ncbi:very long chain fatty acid elongase AAEL008004-like [Dermacentor andersoni]|uniref:very long chain fatty acid elongase AAEL008004-like n=1 Tax=Dermacentor andersoni TaxID=34620 RepID=UPI002155F414|nr:elongation of very long chain fatty acids protein AAEL008004-like [Dermacentor andersoni]